MKQVARTVLILVVGLACISPAHAWTQASRLDSAQPLAIASLRSTPASWGSDSLSRQSSTEWPFVLRAADLLEQPEPATPAETRHAAGNGTFPKWTLVGAALGGVLFGGYAVVAGADEFLPGTRERLIFAGFVSVGALIGYAFDTD